MSVLAKVEQLLAEEADGALKALKHVAGAIEQLGTGGVDVAKLEADIEASFDAKTEQLFAALQQKLEGEISTINSGVGDLLSRVSKLEQPASPAPQPGNVQPVAPAAAGAADQSGAGAAAVAQQPAAAAQQAGGASA